MKNMQPRIPGLERLERATTNVEEKRKALHEEIQSLQDRVLKLELEISLLRIQLEEEDTVEGEDYA